MSFLKKKKSAPAQREAAEKKAAEPESEPSPSDSAEAVEPAPSPVGDAFHDDTAAIQAAFDRAAVAGEPVVLRPGEYHVSRPVELHSGAKPCPCCGTIGAVGSACPVDGNRVA